MALFIDFLTLFKDWLQPVDLITRPKPVMDPITGVGVAQPISSTQTFQGSLQPVQSRSGTPNNIGSRVSNYDLFLPPTATIVGGFYVVINAKIYTLSNLVQNNSVTNIDVYKSVPVFLITYAAYTFTWVAEGSGAFVPGTGWVNGAAVTLNTLMYVWDPSEFFDERSRAFLATPDYSRDLWLAEIPPTENIPPVGARTSIDGAALEVVKVGTRSEINLTTVIILRWLR